MAALITADRLAHLASHAGATSYRWADAQHNQVEHRCSACRRWLPATLEAFSTNGPGVLSARCRQCFGWQPAAAHRAAERRAAEPLDEALSGERSCRCCGARYALIAELWARGPEGVLLHVCATCAHTLRGRAAARGRTRMEGATDVM